MKKSVYIIGSKGIPANYGGFETFVEQLVLGQVNHDIQYYVACLQENSDKVNIKEEFFEYKSAKCFNVKVPNIGPAKAIYYDIIALNKAIDMAKKNKDICPIFYVLACRIGPFINYFKNKITSLGGKLLVNPDGHEWLREKWSLPVRKYWKYSESLMVKNADLLVCDSKNIEKYIQSEYKKYSPRTTYIAYGTDTNASVLDASDDIVRDWYFDKKIRENEYYLVVGRFVPENNYSVMLKEFIKTKSNKDFVLIANVENNSFYKKLRDETKFNQDPRIKFVGTVYNKELLKYIRENAFGYFHGHEVGGTNPSLLEALSATRLNLLLDVGFNREVAEEGALYWKKDELANLIDNVELLPLDYIESIRDKAQARIKKSFSWDFIISEYETLFLNQ